MEDNQTKKQETIDDLAAELADDVKLNEHNLREKALLCSSIWAKWLSRLFAERKTLARIKNVKAEIIKKNMGNVQQSILQIKTEDKIINNDENMKKLKTLEALTNEKLDFIERALQILQGFGFNIKNVTEVLKLQLS